MQYHRSTPTPFFLLQRDLYKMVDSILVPNTEIKEFQSLNADKLAQLSACGLGTKDFLLQKMRINYAFGNRNPLEFINFFNSDNLTKKFKIRKDEVCEIIEWNGSCCCSMYLYQTMGVVVVQCTCIKQWELLLFNVPVSNNGSCCWSMYLYQIVHYSLNEMGVVVVVMGVVVVPCTCIKRPCSLRYLLISN